MRATCHAGDAEFVEGSGSFGRSYKKQYLRPFSDGADWERSSPDVVASKVQLDSNAKNCQGTPPRPRIILGELLHRTQALQASPHRPCSTERRMNPNSPTRQSRDSGPSSNLEMEMRNTTPKDSTAFRPDARNRMKAPDASMGLWASRCHLLSTAARPLFLSRLPPPFAPS